MKKVIGVIMILVGLFFGIGGLWVVSVGGDAVGGIVMSILGFVIFGFGIKLVKKRN